MASWVNRVVIAAPRNGTATHTVDPSSATNVVAGAAFTPIAGRLLVVVAEGAVTSTTPTGWTLPTGGSAINNTGLYVWYRAAAGADTFTTTHNGSNYPVAFEVLEFPTGSTFVGSVAATAVAYTGGAGPTLSGLTGTNLLIAAAAQGLHATSTETVSWSAGTKTSEVSVALAVGTDGYTYSTSVLVDSAASSWSSAATFSADGGFAITAERLVFAIGVAAGGNTGTLSASAPAATAGPPTSSITGTRTVPTYTGSVSTAAPTATAGPPASSIAGTRTVPTFTGGVSASAPGATAGPPTSSIAGTTATVTYTGSVAAPAPAATAGPPASSIAGTRTIPVYTGSVVASAPTVTAGKPTASMSGVCVSPGGGSVYASAPAVVAGPPAASISGVFTIPSATGVLSTVAPMVRVGRPVAVMVGHLSITSFRFTPPVVMVRVGGRSRLFARSLVPEARSVLKDHSGVYRLIDDASHLVNDEDVQNAAAVYLGGYVYEVGADEAADLIEAGFTVSEVVS